MLDVSFVELSQYRLNRGYECLVDAKEAIAKDRYANCANRSYYAIFHGMRAVLALDGRDFKNHSAVVPKFS